MKINKQIKTHIADMAIRKKYKAEFEKKLAALSVIGFDIVYDLNHNEDFDVLPDRAKSLIQTVQGIDLKDDIRMGSYKPSRYYEERGYLLDTAFQTRDTIKRVGFDKKVYSASNYRGNANQPEAFDAPVKELHVFLKEASQARQTLLDAMAHYKSCKKMFAELPWAETYYPEAEKKPVVNVVPVSTIAAANELMEL
ncbi:hypothetical protein NVP1271B_39 [Vibrio phage 1.271.B._10N.286.54.B4]|nr:hypothetical protein NVP1027O_39 [Vibrio phage 1.027.O._10N.286.54.B8]AUR92366.1 hypothetical protein NVP1171O_39 [Vibrio phage 1.171.O._10N.261.52.F12]AUR94419.1 hypothetical protein NVP1194O_39 [Vibrio phage 1.194.O._10N.286.54.B1]AUR94592.1 hypothetical protein NVP1196O_39 [Vibrio phage 1.196.O._10N.286.54.E12]AUR95059.1 hypothetical protein NVP1200O_39 [Vibrio phage 1.200.O._10N.286.55.E1]AUR99547.1 hypothetical protein NVP1267O_39 [Vibrio phage 1.267.O._10N.286.54.A1]AUR99632.1 hypoth